MADWIVVRVAPSDDEALWLRDRLQDVGIEALTPEASTPDAADDRPPMAIRVMVRPADLERASSLLAASPTEGQTARVEHPGVLRTYQEWAEHRFDPGYYLGGNIAPHLRVGDLGPRARRRSALILGLPAVVGAVVWLTDASVSSVEDVLSLATLSLYLAAAVRMVTR